MDSPNYTKTLSFGAGMKRFCMTVAYDHTKPNQLYIDRVENNDLCVIDSKLSSYDKGTVKFIKTALWAMKQLYPTIDMITLHDDSQIYCDENSKTFKLSMSYDYIVKYNKTWYQKHFDAQLPGLIGYRNEKGKTVVDTEDKSLMYYYVESLKALDKSLLPYEQIIEKFPQFKEYETEYKESDTPRKFINKLRETLKGEYCFKVGKWLNHYMRYLDIKLSSEFWFILSSDIEAVPNFTMTQMDSRNAKRVLDGGTRKQKKRSNMKMISDPCFTESCVGVYADYS